MSAPEHTPYTQMSTFLRYVEWPVLPVVGQALIRSLSDENTDTYTVCQIIRKDPALTATLMRMANSAMFGLSGTVDTLERAVSVVGMSLVRTRALSICIMRSYQLPAGMEPHEFWRFCMLCAGFAQWLADLCEVDDQEAWLSGMMLRLGEINLGQVVPSSLPKIELKPIQPGERWVRQRQWIGFDEAEVTAELARHWDFPAPLVSGLRNAGQPLLSNKFDKLAAVLHLAGRLADAGEVTTTSVQALPIMLLQLLKLDPQTLCSNPPDAKVLADVSMFLNT
jgi:HD-like signal output (HDOD) protein